MMPEPVERYSQWTLTLIWLAVFILNGLLSAWTYRLTLGVEWKWYHVQTGFVWAFPLLCCSALLCYLLNRSRRVSPVTLSICLGGLSILGGMVLMYLFGLEMLGV